MSAMRRAGFSTGRSRLLRAFTVSERYGVWRADVNEIYGGLKGAALPALA